MNLTNHTELVAGFTMSTDKAGREWVVVVAKGTYGIPLRPVDEPELLEGQMPLVTCDVFTGEPGFSAPLLEIDFAPHKPRCDVLMNCSAQAPRGRPAERVTVSLRVGSISKSIDVVGKRVWKSTSLNLGPSAIEPFIQQPISYDFAFGGVDRTDADAAKHSWYLRNHAGRGYFVNPDPRAMDGQAMPQTEEVGRPVTSPSGDYKPMAFGPIARAWQPRIEWAGTFDQRWLDETAPFLPADFDDRYFQAAAEDQQMDYPSGGEEVTLLNLTPTGRTIFRLPKELGVAIHFLLRGGRREEVAARVDTVLLEPDQGRFIVVWRARMPLRRNPFEVNEVVIDWMGRRSWIAQERRRLKKRLQPLAGAHGSASRQ